MRVKQHFGRVTAMNKVSCCQPHSLRKGFTIGKWVAPGAALLLIPKCPLCVVAYVAAVTGMGLSFSAAHNLRLGLIAVSLAAIAYLLIRWLLVNWQRINKLS